MIIKLKSDKNYLHDKGMGILIWWLLIVVPTHVILMLSKKEVLNMSLSSGIFGA
jgi:hypothetical protein